MADSLLQTLLARATAPTTTVPSQLGSAASEALNNRGYGRTGAFVQGIGNAVSGMTSPLSLGLSALGPIAGSLASKVAPTAAATEVGGALKPTLTGLGKLAVPAVTRGTRVAETLGEMSPEFTPVGGGGLYNAAKIGVDPLRPFSSVEKYLSVK